MKSFLNKTLTIKQIVALIFLPLVLLGTIFVFTIGTYSIHSAEAVTKDTLTAKVINIAPEPVVIDTSAFGKLYAYVDSINNSKMLFGGGWSFYLADADSGQAVCEVDIDHALMPASVMKIITTGTALSILGPDYRFSTSLQYDGSIDPKRKILYGNIYIHGSGDPTLGSETFGGNLSKTAEQWAFAIKKMGIDSIAGSIIGDAESFDRDPIPSGWTWSDVQSNYGAGSCGLNIHENVFDFFVVNHNGQLRISTSPIIPGMKLYNQVLLNPAVEKSYAYVLGAPFQFDRTVLGEVSKLLKERASIPDPALLCAQALKSALWDDGIGLRDSVSTMRLRRLNNVKPSSEKTKILITSFFSPKLSEIVYHTNQVSQNFYAESILRAVSLQQKGFGNAGSSVNIFCDYWKSRNIDLRGFCMSDGCGLSRMNTVTTHQLVEMLRVYAKDSAVFPAFYNSLPVAGESGTIRKLAGGTAAEGNLHAKSGTMSRVKSYAGYVKTKSGKMLCFAMIANNTQWEEKQLKDKFEKLFVLMADLP